MTDTVKINMKCVVLHHMYYTAVSPSQAHSPCAKRSSRTGGQCQSKLRTPPGFARHLGPYLVLTLLAQDRGLCLRPGPVTHAWYRYPRRESERGRLRRSWGSGCCSPAVSSDERREEGTTAWLVKIKPYPPELCPGADMSLPERMHGAALWWNLRMAW
ncbi:hypothetical protein AAFF_G00096910 [Aldrovandia affinis]|uniref:Uncharacterized protein n=1 Tax=Aldrovandia affinis TaxID=143900 RepID=A0AAD7RVN7_9TELE|nr:hypothetical protein AAFF_G00096910 [Aldrovandia affinis]